MASGKRHALATIVAVPLVAIALGPVAALGTLSGLLLSPDLDHHATTFGIERVPVIGWAWTAFWAIYERAMPHRSIHSHWPIWGTALRVGYVLVFGTVAYLAIYRVPPTFDWLGTPVFIMWFVGLCVSDALHWLMDKI